MATVTGLTAERMTEIEDAIIVDASVDGSGNLILHKNDGGTIDAGSVIGPIGPAGASFIVCTSTTRPSLSAGEEGKAIYETDTKLIRVWLGTRWRLQERVICTSTTRPAGVGTADEGVKIYETDTNLEYIWSGTAWVPVSGVTTIVDTILGSAGIFTFNSIPQTYSHLKLTGTLRSNGAAGGILMRFNSDGAAARYNSQHLWAVTTGPNVTELFNQSSINCGNVGASSVAEPTTVDILIPSYRTGNFKSLQSHVGNIVPNVDMYQAFVVGAWLGTAAITRIDLSAATWGSSFASGSRLTLQGVA